MVQTGIGLAVGISIQAGVLDEKPFQIVAELMEIGVFATTNQLADFDAISKVLTRYGFQAKKAD